MRVVAVTDMRIFGHRELSFALLRVSGRSPIEVAEAIEEFPDVVAVTAVRYPAYDEPNSLKHGRKANTTTPGAGPSQMVCDRQRNQSQPPAMSSERHHLRCLRTKYAEAFSMNAMRLGLHDDLRSQPD